MKQTTTIIFLTVLLFATGCSKSKESADTEPYKADVIKKDETKAKINKNLVLVELFTSEG